MGDVILHKIIERLRTQKGSIYPDKGKLIQYGMVKVQDLQIPIGEDVEVEVTIRKFDADKKVQKIGAT